MYNLSFEIKEKISNREMMKRLHISNASFCRWNVLKFGTVIALETTDLYICRYKEISFV